MCVLIVEDEEGIRQILAEELSFHGHDICLAETGDQAAHFIENPQKAFTLLITDIHMPGTRSGLDVARLMRLHHPSLPIIYTTGRPDLMNIALGPQEALAVKPYSLKEIMVTVRRLLAATHS